MQDHQLTEPNRPDHVQLPLHLKEGKLYYKIGEVAAMLSLKTSTLRHWEEAIPEIKPMKNKRGDRRYTPDDIRKLEQVYTLIKIKGFTVHGAGRRLSNKRMERSELLQNLHSLKAKLLHLSERLTTKNSSTA